MCGIAAVYSYHPSAHHVEKEEIITMSKLMAHRGPDDKGLWCSKDQRVALAHQRLAVIDTSNTGKQPMFSHNKRFCISFNGEIYNYQALKNDLIHKGYHFSGNSDTEVLLHLYEDKQENMLPMLRGMFALVIWDQKQQTLFMARDCYGIKPLYYADDGYTIRIASQVKVLSQNPAISDQKNSAGIVGYFLLGSVPEPHTCYKDIKAVPAGSFIKINTSGCLPAIQWKTVSQLFVQAEKLSNQYSEKALRVKFREALSDSIQHHLVSDIPIGIFLSAGIDSSSLLGLIYEDQPSKSILQSITIGFDQFKHTQHDEVPLASKVAKCFKSPHHTHYISESDFHQELPSLLESMDQPSLDGVNMWFACKAAKQHGLKVMLSGVGGDELLGGYPSFQDIPKLRRWLGFLSSIPMLGSTISAIGRTSTIDRITSRLVSRKFWYMLEHANSDSNAWFLRRGIFMPEQLKDIIPNDVLEDGLDQLNLISHIHNSGIDQLNSDYAKIAVLESSLYMRNQLLRDMDWVSMAFSIETRTPFVDYHLTPYIAALLIKNPTILGKKHLVHSAIKDQQLNKILTNRAKSGFTTPVAKWLQSNSKLNHHINNHCPVPKTAHWSQQYTYALGKHFFSDILN